MDDATSLGLCYMVPAIEKGVRGDWIKVETPDKSRVFLFLLYSDYE